MKISDDYFKKTLTRERHPLLTLTHFFIKHRHKEQKKLKAIDLGCGTGGDTLYLLEQGFEVTALDAEQTALMIVKNRAKKRKLPAATLVEKTMEEVNFSKQVDLVTSNLALPFIEPAKFSAVWSKMVQSLHFGGIFFWAATSMV